MLKKMKTGTKTEEGKIWGTCPNCENREIQFDSCCNCGTVFSEHYEDPSHETTSTSVKTAKAGSKSRKIRFSPKWITLMGGVVTISFFVTMVLGVTSLANARRSALDTEMELGPRVRIKITLEAIQMAGMMKNTSETAPERRQELHASRSSSKVLNRGPVEWVKLTRENRGLIPYFFKGKEFFEEGVVLSKEGKFGRAVEKFEAALSNLRKFDHKKSIALTSLNLAICYQALGNTQVSLNHFDNVVEIAKENGHKEYEAKAHQGISLIFNAIARYKMAMAHLKRAMTLHTDINDEKGLAMDSLIKGMIEDKLNLDGAERHFSNALHMSGESNDTTVSLKAGQLLNEWLDRGSEETV